MTRQIKQEDTIGQTSLFDQAEDLLELEQRKLVKILSTYKKHFGAGIIDLMKDPTIVEIKRLPDDNGRIWIRKFGESDTPTKFMQEELSAQYVVQSIADYAQKTLTRISPILLTIMPSYHLRFTAMIEPLTSGVFWTIRKRIVNTLALEDYVKEDKMSKSLFDGVCQKIKDRKRFAILGPQGVGKSLLASAVLNKTAELFPKAFLAVLEDVSELSVRHNNILYITTNNDSGFTVSSMIPALLRTGATSISIGEITAGADATIEGWTTGVKHTSVMTIHGEDAVDAYLRIEQLLQKENKPVSRTMIQKAIPCVLVIKDSGGGMPLVESLWEVANASLTSYDLSLVAS